MKEICIINQDITLALKASHENPLYNPIFIIQNLAIRKLGYSVHGKSMKQTDFEYRTEYDINDIPTTIIWIEMDTEDKITLIINKLE